MTAGGYKKFLYLMNCLHNSFILRCNLHSIKFTLLKCTNNSVAFRICTELCNNSLPCEWLQVENTDRIHKDFGKISEDLPVIQEQKENA